LEVKKGLSNWLINLGFVKFSQNVVHSFKGS